MTDRPTIAVRRLQARTVDEIAESVRLCDVCGDECLYGAAASLRVGFAYHELCEACLRALVEQAAAVAVPAPREVA